MNSSHTVAGDARCLLTRMRITVLERGWLSSNNVLLHGEDGWAIVDTGYATHAEQTLALVQHTVGAEGLTVIANTHLHSNHCGGNAALHAHYPLAARLIPAGQSQAVEAWDTEALTYAPTGQICPRFGYDRLLRDGETVRLGGKDWCVLGAGGHDPHSIILFEPTERVLISADALWENGFGIVFPELEGKQAFDEVAETLDLIASLEPACVIPGHGAVFSDASAALARARSRLAMFSGNPAKHRRHALKVLVKFKLLEWQRCLRADLGTWFQQSAYFEGIARQDSGLSIEMQLDQLIQELVAVNALRIDGEWVINS